MTVHRPSLASAILLLAALAVAQDPAATKRPDHLEPGASCTAQCHADRATGAFVHKPGADGKCVDCHKQDKPTEHAFAAIDDVNAQCLGCHKVATEAVVHAPFESVDCTACHDPHRSAVKSLLVSPDEQTLCFTCHEKIKAALATKHPHGPATQGCTTCHAAHSSAQPKLLRAEPAEACLKCHEDLDHALTDAEIVHAPLMQSCTPCHDPHGTDLPHSVKEEQPALCLGCHKPLREALAAATSPHGALASEKRCLTCHRVHESKFPGLLQKPSGDLCTDCHSTPQPRAGGGPPVAPIAAEVKSHKLPHAPAKERHCVQCHKPHVSAHPKLLGRSYPQLFYAPYSAATYELCLGCHDPKTFAEAKTTTATGFRDGERNLHVVHVADKEKGRTCRACHEIHGGDTPKHIAAAVRFGEWNLPIRWEQLPTGGRCAPGCHKPQTYDHGPMKEVPKTGTEPGHDPPPGR